jgi:hypothetical protein
LAWDWCDATTEATSNYQELKNLVNGLEEMVCLGRLKTLRSSCRDNMDNTDNTTAGFLSGNSTS